MYTCYTVSSSWPNPSVPKHHVPCVLWLCTGPHVARFALSRHDQATSSDAANIPRAGCGHHSTYPAYPCRIHPWLALDWFTTSALVVRWSHGLGSLFTGVCSQRQVSLLRLRCSGTIDEGRSHRYWFCKEKLSFRLDFQYSEFCVQLKVGLFKPSQWMGVFAASGAKRVSHISFATRSQMQIWHLKKHIHMSLGVGICIYLICFQGKDVESGPAAFLYPIWFRRMKLCSSVKPRNLFMKYL